MFSLPALLFIGLVAGADGAPKTSKDALKPLNALVGSWKGTGTPEGTREEREKGFWTETIACAWQFKGDDAWLALTFEKGKYFARGDLRYVADKNQFQLTLTPATEPKDALVFTGTMTAGKRGEQALTLDRTDTAANQTQRLVVTLLHANRFLYRCETKPTTAPEAAFARKYQVGATKEGEPFASANTGPECVVTGGRGTSKVTYKGQTYYVCCSGCRDAFMENPEKYVKMFEAKQK
ncbi:YHS domain-containing protein [Fimbriiglobus ruber]|uniref:YHS domain-containing protein n=1 Tax=Fimbriiglobus ruber TaxID=1908690 RepID=A0A225DGK3_9BACT|nr:YHS domain-containing protein [Fimbriiglobus ruber]OWK35535.1 hypothetical protein FRUB_08098 [Fimbriiglobus ruber]